MALFASKIFRRSYHISNVAFRHHRHNKIPPKIMKVNTCYRFPQFNRVGLQPQKYDYFLVLDFEATCEPNFELKKQVFMRRSGHHAFPCAKNCELFFMSSGQCVLYNPQEIIEFPCLIIDSRTYEEVDRFHQFVKPLFNPTLSVFCTQLTGILQVIIQCFLKLPFALKMDFF